MSSNGHEPASLPVEHPVSIDELFRDVPPLTSVEDLACEGIFDSDEEVAEFLAHTYDDRRVNVA